MNITLGIRLVSNTGPFYRHKRERWTDKFQVKYDALDGEGKFGEL